MRLRGSLGRAIKKKLMERKERKAIFKKEYKKHEPEYIRKSARAALKMKYKAKMKPKISWALPQPGQRSVGQNIFDAMAGKPFGGKIAKVRKRK